MYGPADEQALVRDLAAGREAAFAALYDRYSAQLFRVAWSIIGVREEAEDAVQDIFVNLVKARHGMAGIENLQAYLVSSVHRAAVRRANKQRDQRESLQEAQPMLAARAIMQEPVPDSVDALLQKLPLEQREVVALKIQGRLTFQQIAEALGISANTAASRYRYALEKLRAMLQGAQR
jgi:RNA polymerase sigma-70 factor, ECF subfamily